MTQDKLHISRIALNSGEICEICRSLRGVLRVEFDSVIGKVDASHFLRVGDVENFPAELEFVIFPWQIEGFAEA